MAKRIILAVAGAGKTYYICHKINPNKRNLILAFTHENIYNILNELRDAHGCVPELTTVSTFDSFVYHNLVLPYEPTIAEYFNNSDFVSQGICTIDPPPMCIPGSNQTTFPNPHYFKKDRLEHYITKKRQYYCATLSELVLQIKQNHECLVKRAASRLNLFYDCILIDEFQDFREHNYELIITLTKHLKDVLFVGDYYQHSVSAINNSGKPFKKKSTEISYNDFISNMKNTGFEVDLTTLNKSIRCSKEICEYVSKKLNISITSYGKNIGSVIWVNKNAEEIIKNQHIVKLVYKDASRYTFQAINWSYSKGDTMNEVCVILTDKLEKLADDEFTAKGISDSTRNKLYVAMTRSRGNLYLMKASTFKEIKNRYFINF